MADDSSPILLVKSGGPAVFPDWQAAFRAVLPQVEVRDWADPAVDADRGALRAGCGSRMPGAWRATGTCG